MKFKATVAIMPRPEILDPQGKAILLGMENLGFEQFSQVRVGRRIELELEAADEAEAQKTMEEACRKLLANPVIEQYELSLEKA